MSFESGGFRVRASFGFGLFGYRVDLGRVSGVVTYQIFGSGRFRFRVIRVGFLGSGRVLPGLFISTHKREMKLQKRNKLAVGNNNK